MFCITSKESCRTPSNDFTSSRLNRLTESGSISSLPPSPMRRSHSRSPYKANLSKNHWPWVIWTGFVEISVKRFPPEKWTSLSSVSGPTGISKLFNGPLMHNYLNIITTTTTNTDSISFSERPRSSSCSSASSSRTQEGAARCPGPLHRPWCLHLPSRWERTISYNLEIWWSETSFSGASALWVAPTPNASRVKPSSAPTFLECPLLSPQ